MALPERRLKWAAGRALLAAFCIAAGIAWPFKSVGHVGMRLRLGYRREPLLSALARMTEIYVEAVSGYSIDLKEYREAGILQEDVKAEKVDVAIEYPAEAWVRTVCPTAGALAENVFPHLKSYYMEKYGAVWVGMFLLRREGLECNAPSYVISRGVANDISYYTLPDYLKKLIAAVTPEDIREILRLDSKGTDRDLIRKYLAKKKLI